MEKIKFLNEETGIEDEFYVLEQTKLNENVYLLVAVTADADSECLILKDLSDETEPESVYEAVEDEAELEAVSRIFEELLEDFTIER